MPDVPTAHDDLARVNLAQGSQPISHEIAASLQPHANELSATKPIDNPLKPDPTQLDPAQPQVAVPASSKSAEFLFWAGLILFGSVIASAFLLKKLPERIQPTLIELFNESSFPSTILLPALVGAIALSCGIVLQIGAQRLRDALAFVRSLGPAGILAAGALVLPPLGSIVLFATFNITAPWLRDHAELGVLIYVAAFAGLAGLALLPTYAQSALGGFAFGVTLGIPAALCGFVGGAFIGYTIARRCSGDHLERTLANKPKWRAVRDAITGRSVQSGRLGFMRALGMVILLRLPPNSPFAFMNIVLASSRVPRGAFLLGTAVGMLPRTALAVIIGAGINETFNKEALERAAPPWAFVVAIVVSLAIFAIVGTIANKAIERVANSPINTPPAN